MKDAGKRPAGKSVYTCKNLEDSAHTRKTPPTPARLLPHPQDSAHTRKTPPTPARLCMCEAPAVFRCPALTPAILNFSVSHALSWKFIKPHMVPLVQDIIFPLMCHSDEDEELWQSDPVEYIRVKFGT